MPKLKDQVVESLPACGPMQLQRFAKPVRFVCMRCGPHNAHNARVLAVVQNDWTKLLCKNCYTPLSKHYGNAE